MNKESLLINSSLRNTTNSTENTDTRISTVMTISNGDMYTSASLPHSHNMGYIPGVTFKYGFITNPEDSQTNRYWHPIQGNHIEYWYIPDENLYCIELRADDGSYGIKQKLMKYKEESMYPPEEYIVGSRFYMITWKDRCRLDDEGEDTLDNVYSAMVSLGDPSENSIISKQEISITKNQLSATEWRNRAMVIELPLDWQFNGNDIFLSFQNTNGSTFGSLITDVDIHHICLRDEATIIMPTFGETNTESIAWIKAHTSRDNPAPRMPELALSCIFPAEHQPEYEIQARLEVKYTRPEIIGDSGNTKQKNDEIIARDTVVIPSTGYRTFTDTWNIFEEEDWLNEVNYGFFGGDATIFFDVYTINGTNKEKINNESYEYRFRIAGQNPNDDKCKAYICDYLNVTYPTEENVDSLSDMAWCIPAIAMYESYGYSKEVESYYPYIINSNLNKTVFNQFSCNNTNLASAGIPVHRNYEKSGAGGFGMYQVTGSINGIYDAVKRDTVWNWQKNITAAMDIIAYKFNVCVNMFSKQLAEQIEYEKNLSDTQKHPLPNYKLVNSEPRPDGKGTTYNFDIGQNLDKKMVHLCTIKAYNGASRYTTNYTEPSEIIQSNPLYRFDSRYVDHYCMWLSAKYNNGSDSKPWIISKRNGGGIDYVDRVVSFVDFNAETTP